MKPENLPVLHDRPTREDAEAAVRTLIAWAGDDPERPGLLDTPRRVVKAYEEFFAGYRQAPQAVLARTFEDVTGYQDLVLMKGIRLESHCEHHMVPMLGWAHVAYVPGEHVVGLSKLARLVDVYAKRLQTQERMTLEIAEALNTYLQPRGVAVMVEASHQCMTTRGIHKAESKTITHQMTGQFTTDAALRDRFFTMLRD